MKIKKKLGSSEIHSQAIDIFKEKINEFNKISKERQKYGLVVMAVPGLENLSEKDYRIVKQACNHIIEDVKEYQRTKVKIPIGTKLEILKV